MTVRDLPPRPALVVDPQTSLAEVARRMRLEDSDAAAVVAGGRLVGIVTERNLVGVIADGIDAGEATAELSMSRDPATVTPDEEVVLVAVKMVALGVRHVTVVDENEHPIGLVSARDLVTVLDRSAV